MAEAPGLRARKKEETRRLISTTAIELFLERGFDAVSVADIAAAAGVSKMTVFNYFPAKEDLVFRLDGVGALPPLAAAVRERAPGVSAVAALRALLHGEFDDRREWTGLHDGVAPFARMAFGSQTLIEGFGRQWRDAEGQLAIAFAEALGQKPPPPDLEQRFFSAVSGHTPPAEVRAMLDELGAAQLRPRGAAAQVIAAIQSVTIANLARQAAGLTADDSADAAHAELDEAFNLLEFGLGAIGAG